MKKRPRASLLRISSLSLVLLLTSLLEGHEPRFQPNNFTRKVTPSHTPDRIVLTWSGDPASSQSVTWRTDSSIPESFAELTIAADHANGLDPSTWTADTQFLLTDQGGAHYHTVSFTSLNPGTTYAYRVGQGEDWSEWFHFKTAHDHPEQFSFIYFGDAQNDIKNHWSRVAREAFRDGPRAAFVLHVGDLVNHGNRDAEWNEWMEAPGWFNATIPIVATPGNHEYHPAGIDPFGPRKRPPGSTGAVLSPHWRAQFEFPKQSPTPETEETCYYLDIQGIRLIVLDSNIQREEQLAWLEKKLESNTQNWTILAFHHPLFSHNEERDKPNFRELWKPVIDRYKVDLVLTGHDHTYTRTGEINNVKSDSTGRRGLHQAYDPDIGTVYVVSVSGPKNYGLGNKPRSFAKRAATEAQLYQIVTVDSEQLTLEARTATGALFDSFTLQKRAGRPNLLIENKPE
ncbi:metallophosphoesterase family protein [Pelagicoccus enzymogenes]|uniref:metallophosphoesterase family protein n=1 Tax=Pelagicoccus enzymogenes TaxID=2773457 RepID=UPI00280CFAC4|nr:metallophosphoesterase family protein [Pelagicoccus enzymogenes]MDQ8199433.1 metallophosphoesterase family protein [Pelagicoccus enzymogenes]